MFQEHCQVHGSGFLVLEVKGLLSRDCQLSQVEGLLEWVWYSDGPGISTWSKSRAQSSLVAQPEWP